MPFDLSDHSPLDDWSDNSHKLDDGNYEWENEEEDVLIRVLSSDDGNLWQVDLFETSTDNPRVTMAHSWIYRETLRHANTARAVAEEYAQNYQTFFN